ncbi:S8 family serine peptidase [Solwaraspora sp. WMMD791]|uniref:S8 family serine peptidase n=1 Tax=Solwaraspora sp. WMMD791 TaxID=3016086 RepID=UPI00249B1CDC|nr:S8 family serine peptidase [Solwaraspora sp. WMMD791]WFE28859.1 S8 family serine peptidase [Solwaraspora sp. WMMD791]
MTFSRPSRRHWRLALTATAVAAATVAFAAPANAAPAEGPVLYAGESTTVADSYIVVFKDERVSRTGVPAAARAVAARHDAAVVRTYTEALRGFEARMSEKAAKRLAASSAVKYVQQNRTVSLAATQTPTPSWGLDRIDQSALPLNNSYTYPNSGSGVTAYIIDTGIRFSHSDFGGRAVTGFDAVDGGSADDGNGHGTHVAGTVGGTAYGVAKDVTLVGVRVLNNSGSGTYAGVIAGIDWVTADHGPGEPAVANMSLGGGFDQAVNDAVARSIDDGVVYSLAAGNSNANACNYSPASTPAAITVGATTSTDARASYSNYGTCVDIFAPGSAITSAWHTGDTATNTINGTSMAAPHVAGAAALALAANPGYTPAQIGNLLIADATDGVVTNPGTGSPNKLLYVGNIVPPTQDFTVEVAPAGATVDPGDPASATVSTTTAVGDPHTVTFSVTGAPAGVTAEFSPASVTSGGATTLTLDTAASTEPGTYRLTIVGTGPETSQSAPFTLTVNGPPGCSQTNSTDFPISDNSTTESAIVINGCAGNARAASTIEVNIYHTWIGDLTVSLIAPDGSAYVLHSRTGSSTDNIFQTYTRDLSSEVADGTWKLRVQDSASLDTGYLDSWTLNL